MRKLEEVGRPYKSNLLGGTKVGKWRTAISISLVCVLGISQACVVYWGYQKAQKEKKETGVLTSGINLYVHSRMTERYKELELRKAQLQGTSVSRGLNDKSS